MDTIQNIFVITQNALNLNDKQLLIVFILFLIFLYLLNDWFKLETRAKEKAVHIANCGWYIKTLKVHKNYLSMTLISHKLAVDGKGRETIRIIFSADHPQYERIKNLEVMQIIYFDYDSPYLPLYKWSRSGYLRLKV